ncbi:MAG: sulfotransferase [Candidatus Thermoplasmatota archaeon]|nr:sulfotransferase [Candidatus Thermoplasmatota archaeon]
MSYVPRKQGETIPAETTLDDEYRDRIKNTTFTPVFLLGLHRSGTTILYHLLNETGNFTTLTLYHVLQFDRLLYNHFHGLTEKEKQLINKVLKEKGITTRKTDAIQVSADYEHEYVYIFSKRNYPWHITEKNKELFELLCKKITIISESDKPLLLKNPYDYPNFLTIKKMYPQAKFVFIQRNPLDVISSTMKLWKGRLTEKDEFVSLYSKEMEVLYRNPFLLFLYRVFYTMVFPPGVFEVLRRVKTGTDSYVKNIQYLSKDDYLSVRYEDLCEKPNEVMNTILTFLGRSSKRDFSGYVKPRKLRLTPEVSFLKTFIYKRMKKYFTYFGYTI